MTYPPPPWHTRGHGFAQSYLVDSTTLVLPPGFEPVTMLGRTVGILAYIEYVPPSPLSYRELIWMPCMVRVHPSGGRTHRGYYVEKMYVDSEASLEAGRTEWALPKQLATFVRDGSRVVVDTEDGAHLELAVGARGPGLRAPVASSTLQDAGDHVVRFRGTGSAVVGAGHVTVRASRGLDAWPGWEGARRLPALGAALRDFAITMHEPRRIEHALS